MKRGTLNFLGRKNQSLFDTNVKMKDMDNVELVLSSGTIIESGTASVRARPTVKHYSSSSDSFQGFAVPTPTVPLFAPAVNGTKFNGSVSDDQSSNGSTISVSDPIEGEIFVPPPPSSAPPPPPEFFMLPPPEFLGDLSALQPPPMQAPKPPSQFVYMQEDDFNFLTPPPMSPPKPPSTTSGGSSSSVPISSPIATNVPEHPQYAPPQPPTEKQKTFKTPPPKPLRISSVQSMDLPPDSPAPPPPVHTPTLSTFNPQSPAKLYSAPKSTFLNGNEEQGPKIKPKLLLEDTGTGPTVLKDAKAPTKPLAKSIEAQQNMDVKPDIPKPALEVKERDTAPKITVPPPPATPPEPAHERKPITAADLKEFAKSPKTFSVNTSPQHTKIETKTKTDEPDVSSTHSSKYSPMLEHKLRGINGPSAPKDTSPLALLMAAKQRDRHRTSGHENSFTSRSSLTSTNSGSSLSVNSLEERPESPKSEPIYATVKKSPVKPTIPSAGSPFPDQTAQEARPSRPNPQEADGNVDVDVPFLPPPPEFGDFGNIELPPAVLPPDPPKMPAPIPPAVSPAPPKLPTVSPASPKPLAVSPVPPKLPTVSPASPKPLAVSPVPPKPPAQKPITTPVIPTPPKPAPAPPPPPIPHLPPLSGPTVKAKPPPVQTKPKLAQAPLPTPTTPSQATLLNILKKKMMEMDHKLDNDVGEQDSYSDDWGSSEDSPVPVIPKVHSPKNTVVNKSATLDMHELQSRVAQKNPEISPNRIPIPQSNGPSKHQYGMTFTVRPGTKQPITLVRKGES